MDEFLFDKGPPRQPSPAEVARGGMPSGAPRLRLPQRDQIEMRCAAIDELLEADHQARMVWNAVCGLDLSRWLEEIKAVQGSVGRDATDPRLLVALWVYATLDGVGSARELARLCEKHLAYQWLCGGVSVNYHLLADFRSPGGDKWEHLLTQLVASLMAENLVTMQRVAQDGMRVRAARQRAAEEREQRLEEALRHCEQLQQQREQTAKISGRKPTAARASRTDPEARTMKFPRRWLRAGIQRPVQHRHGDGHRRGCGSDQRRHCSGTIAADVGSTRSALRSNSCRGPRRRRVRLAGNDQPGRTAWLHGVRSAEG